MNAERFARLKAVLIKVADLPSSERMRILDATFHDDPELRREAESILSQDENARDFLEQDDWLKSGTGEPGDGAPDGRGPLTGSLVSHYRVLDRLGEGGMGEVYRAEDTRLGRAVALKFLRRDVVGHGESRARFVREAQAAAALDHPNIRTIYAIEEWEETLFLAMAFVDGPTLAERIAAGNLATREALEIAVQVAAGLQAAHARGIIHRDIKSSNIILSPEGRAQIMDFGLARSTGQSDLTRTGAIMGTIAYMSPEQARGGSVDHRTDIWALGVVLSEMLTGELPFRGANDVSVISAILHDEPTVLVLPDGSAPADLERVRANALAKDPAARYQAVSDMLADLERARRRVADGVPDSTAPTYVPQRRAPSRPAPGRGPRTGRIVRPSARAAAVLAVAGVAVIAATLWSLGPGRPGTVTPVLESKSVLVTSGRGEEARSAISPDGGRIAYVAIAEGAAATDIFMVDVHGGNPLRLTDNDASDFDPEWFPDGSSIAFVSDRQGLPSIWKVGQLGGGAVFVVANAMDPGISPDGTRIAFARPNAEGWARIMVAPIADPAKAVALTGEDDGLWNHRSPSWSPDGRMLCYAARDGIWTVPSAGGPARRLTPEGYEDSSPCWSSDGARIYFGAGPSGARALWQVDLREGEAKRLTLGSGQETHPSVSRDGRRLAYCTFRARYRLVLRDLVAGTDRDLPGLPAETMVALSPDETCLVFNRKTPGDGTDLWLQPLREDQPVGPPRRLTSQTGVVSHPTFSPDGRFIAYYRIAEHIRRIWVVPTAGGSPTRMTFDSTQDLQPAWSPDGAWLAYVSKEDAGYAIRRVAMRDGMAAGKPQRVTGDDMTSYAPSWSPDGSLLAFVGLRDEQREVWVVRPDGTGGARRVSEGAVAVKVRWDAATPGAMLVMGTWGGEGLQLRRVFLDERPPEDLRPPIELGSDAELGFFDVSSSGRLLAYSRNQDPRSDIWLLEAEPGSY